MDAGAALTAATFAIELAIRAADVDARIAYDAGYDCSGLEDAYFPGDAAFRQLLRGAVKTIAK
jgi:hypothetical protein